MTSDAFVHSHALYEAGDIGDGTRVWAFAHVMDGAVVGRACNVGDHAVVERGAYVGNGVTIKNGVTIPGNAVVADEVFIGPNAVFESGNGQIRVGEGATIGANATIGAGLRVGAHAFVAAGSVVLADVPDHAMVVGSPARRTGWICECATALGSRLSCPSCGRSFAVSEDGLVARTVEPIETPNETQ